MSESATPANAGNATASIVGPPLTPEVIEGILAEFRAWLNEPAHTANVPTNQLPEPVDLHTLVAQFAALRHEVNLQTKAVRMQQEQTAEALQKNTELFQSLEAASEQVAEAQEQEHAEVLKPLLRAMIESADAQWLALREVQRLLRNVEALLKVQAPRAVVAPEEPPRLPFLARLFGADRVLTAQQLWLKQLEHRLEVGEVSRWPLAPATADTIRRHLEATASGLAMGLQRIERAMSQCGLEPIAAVGQPFDPERMEAVEVAANSDRPSREVVEEVRRGYIWNSRVLRFAQVKVAK